MSKEIGGTVSPNYVLIIPNDKQSVFSVGETDYITEIEGIENFGEIINAEDKEQIGKIVHWTRSVQEYTHEEQKYIWVNVQDVVHTWTQTEFRQWQENLRNQ